MLRTQAFEGALELIGRVVTATLMLGACAETGAIAPDAPRTSLDAAQVIAELKARYATLKSYQDRGIRLLVPGKARIPAGQGQIIMSAEPSEFLTFKTWFVAPNKLRFEWERTAGEHGVNVLVSDGDRTLICSRRTCECEDSPTLSQGLQQAEELGGDSVVGVTSLLGLDKPNRVESLADVSAALSRERVEIMGRDTSGGADRRVVLVLDSRGLLSYRSLGPAKLSPAKLEEMNNRLASVADRGQGNLDHNARVMLAALLQMSMSATMSDEYRDVQRDPPIPDDVFQMPTMDSTACKKDKR